MLVPDIGRPIDDMSKDTLPRGASASVKWHPLTRSWPAIALRDCRVAAKSARPPAWG